MADVNMVTNILVAALGSLCLAIIIYNSIRVFKKKHKLDRRKLTTLLIDIASELDARESGSHSVIKDLRELSYNTLCDMGIDVLRGLKE